MEKKEIRKTAEYERLHTPKKGFLQAYDDWGAYVSERAWGTVREDYSLDGDAWNYLSHDAARSTAYRWSEDGIAAFSDRAQFLIFSCAFWNEKDPILKERMFGLTSQEGNHGEDVKEYYYYLDALPSQSYMKYLYKYPHAAYPYVQLIEENKKRGLNDREFELVDTGIFNEDRYFDIVIEYAKASPDDICIKVEAFNRSNETAPLHVLGQLWFRNRWSWDPKSEKVPMIRVDEKNAKFQSLRAESTKLSPSELLTYKYELPPYYFYAPADSTPLFTHNDTNFSKFPKEGKSNRTPYVKDAFHRYIIEKEASINPNQEGTKACFHCIDKSVKGKTSAVFYFRLSTEKLSAPFKNIEEIFRERKEEADEYYAALHHEYTTEDERNIQRQALAGSLWSQQFYNFSVHRWLNGDDPKRPLPEERKKIRNEHWMHLHSAYTMSMPDKWEYPWFASWDLAFQCLPLALVNLDLGKNQLSILLREHFQHSNGQLPAYEWEFSDLNPPLQAWSLWRICQMEKKQKGKIDYEFMGRCFHKILINFGWWVNKVDKKGNNLFEGGFLGLDNISVIDRDQIPQGESLEQSDGTGWIGFLSLTMMRLSMELAQHDPSYLGLATKFLDNFIFISRALEACDQKNVQMWNDQEGFFYDVLCYPDGRHEQLKVRSLVGIIPLFATEFFTQEEIDACPRFKQTLEWNETHRPNFMKGAVVKNPNGKKGYLFSLIKTHQIEQVLKYVWDENEFRSKYGLRSLSKYHEQHPYTMDGHQVRYEPGESLEKIKGGNSNWRGPVWFPPTFLLIEAMKKLDEAFGNQFSISSGNKKISAKEIGRTFAMGLIDLFKKSPDNNRPIFDNHPIFKRDEFKDHILFFEHYHGDTGRGLGASHQTGWSALVANLIDEWCGKE